ncbi:IS110 family transposase [Undibacterium sp. YM2]|uniref:IS110 family transposase n=1 Tax=Undibacterium sp. YM2 TaxID=2058625 RepID=UPI001331D863|nr:IS110 family transposase [Undibacterium sp. YM2]BBB68353.1 IS110 family transposase [Undibacterium sp. YM2]BBB68416.1 IS110 family transposase [Undibacterium sp. YM2]BBB68429.1 IS110 family transposase [Undibacterium sp. YM2]BBB68433.1 IS110 family transposase [Undibacterium sp. YM2]BBB68437.1 IS110 family transposase [Undibacterium sp. YM2]
MQSPLCIGVDVAKSEVVIACSESSFPVRAVPNELAALKKFLKQLPPGSSIAMEATGTYHQMLADLAFQMGLHVYVLNPKDTRHYAKGVGARAKTDNVDAMLIARYLAHEIKELRRYEPATPEQRTMDELLKRRAKIVSLKTALRLTCDGAPSLKVKSARLLDSFTELLKQIDQDIARLNKDIPKRDEQVCRLQSIAGVGLLTSSWLANLFDRVRFTNSDAVVAFVGMDPRPCDSGQKRGRRRLSKRGPAEGRRLLFNAGMAAAKSKVWAPVYQHYRQLGWPSTATIMIIARKILRIAFSLIKNGVDFNSDLISIKT